MDSSRDSKKKLLRKAYIRTAFVCMVVLFATNILGFIDNIIIGRILGAQALAAVGYFAPLASLSSLPFVIIVGSSLLCGNLIGSGQQQKVNSLFTSAFLAIVFFGIVFTAILMIFSAPLGTILGARNESHRMLISYIMGFSPSIVFSYLCSMLITLAPYNNEIKRSYVATTVMLFGNIIFDIALANPLGTFGIGLASTISSIASLLILLPSYCSKNSTIHLEKKAFDYSLVFEAAKRGLPSLFFTAGMLIKSSLINYTMITYVGEAGIAVSNVLASVNCLTGAVTGGCYNAHSSLSSLTYGEEDRESNVDLYHMAIKMGFICQAVLLVILMGFSEPLSVMFFKNQPVITEMGQKMFLLGFIYIPFNLLMNLYMNSYKIQGRMHLVNFIAFTEVAIVGVMTVLMVPAFGVNSAWLANTWADIIMLIVILISVAIWKKGISFTAESLLKIPKDFGAAEDELAEYDIENIDEVSPVSKALIEFCKGRGVDERNAFWVGLCTEEITRNILQHGDFHEKRSHVSVRVICKDELTIRIQDDCIKFDPRQRMEMYNPKDPESNIGLRMVAKIASSVDYYNNAGINTLIMKI